MTTPSIRDTPLDERDSDAYLRRFGIMIATFGRKTHAMKWTEAQNFLFLVQDRRLHLYSLSLVAW